MGDWNARQGYLHRPAQAKAAAHWMQRLKCPEITRPARPSHKPLSAPNRAAAGALQAVLAALHADAAFVPRRSSASKAGGWGCTPHVGGPRVPSSACRAPAAWQGVVAAPAQLQVGMQPQWPEPRAMGAVPRNRGLCSSGVEQRHPVVGKAHYGRES